MTNVTTTKDAGSKCFFKERAVFELRQKFKLGVSSGVLVRTLGGAQFFHDGRREGFNGTRTKFMFMFCRCCPVM